jgi:predicted cupin superfamily sugar epimerase
MMKKRTKKMLLVVVPPVAAATVVHHRCPPPLYSIIAEAVAPGFDVQDFEWVTFAQLVATTGCRADVVTALSEYLRPDTVGVGVDKATHFDRYYDYEK